MRPPKSPLRIAQTNASLDRSAWYNTTWQRKRKRRALPNFAPHPNVTALHLDESLCKRKSQPGAFWLALIFGLNLTELLED
jgi:hypothetical protein